MLFSQVTLTVNLPTVLKMTFEIMNGSLQGIFLAHELLRHVMRVLNPENIPQAFDDPSDLILAINISLFHIICPKERVRNNPVPGLENSPITLIKHHKVPELLFNLIMYQILPNPRAAHIIPDLIKLNSEIQIPALLPPTYTQQPGQVIGKSLTRLPTPPTPDLALNRPLQKDLAIPRSLVPSQNFRYLIKYSTSPLDLAPIDCVSQQFPIFNSKNFWEQNFACF